MPTEISDTPTGEATGAGSPPLIEVTDAARDIVLEARSEEDDAEKLGLRIRVVGIRGTDYAYDLAFEPSDDVEEGETVLDFDGLAIMVPADSADKLRGSTLDVPSQGAQGGLVLRNPNRPNPLEGVELELSGDLAEKVMQLLDGSINPSLAAHGGFAELIGVENDNVFITMGGGCQGCAMSRATLTEGITVAIKEAIPEVAEVIDVTDHQAGDNPFY
ncbi:MAG: Fe/S biogenesis protein NfuA [Acidimicrobiales bacterium]|nr:MAG: hypothetical protein EDR02_16355 [Actinomycetota bacterium]MBV6508112.1 Fe/S biogenesis protein NfuA [Acidimicrobiales bacterium]RIK03858.1 MAG: hypothetical protein DCC48_15205 [Acidobacteriota bacterium]